MLFHFPKLFFQSSCVNMNIKNQVKQIPDPDGDMAFEAADIILFELRNPSPWTFFVMWEKKTK